MHLVPASARSELLAEASSRTFTLTPSDSFLCSLATILGDKLQRTHTSQEPHLCSAAGLKGLPTAAHIIEVIEDRHRHFLKAVAPWLS